jgi:hypothetical protein
VAVAASYTCDEGEEGLKKGSGALPWLGIGSWGRRLGRRGGVGIERGVERVDFPTRVMVEVEVGHNRSERRKDRVVGRDFEAERESFQRVGRS